MARWLHAIRVDVQDLWSRPNPDNGMIPDATRSSRPHPRASPRVRPGACDYGVGRGPGLSLERRPSSGRSPLRFLTRNSDQGTGPDARLAGLLLITYGPCRSAAALACRRCRTKSRRRSARRVLPAGAYRPDGTRCRTGKRATARAARISPWRWQLGRERR